MAEPVGKDRWGRDLYDAVCCECGNHCKVPFDPKPDKEVRCYDCWSRIKRKV